MADEVSIVVRAVDNFSSVLGNFGSIMTGIESTINLVKGAFNAAVDAIQPFVNSAMENEVAVSGLDAILKSTNNTIGLTSQQLQNMATGLQNVTGYSDEAIVSAEGMLLRYEHITKDIFPDAIRLATDLSRSLGVDLTSAARMVGMALDDPEQGIGRLNMQFRIFNDTEMETIKNMAKNGDIAGAQTLIMQALTEKVGGAANAYGNTFAGALAIANEKLDNFRELIGGPIIEALGILLNKFMGFVEGSPIYQGVVGFFTEVNSLLSADFPLLDAIGFAMIRLEGAGTIFHDIGFALLDFQGRLNDGATAGQAFGVVLYGLIEDGGPLAGLAQKILNIKQAFDSGGIAAAFGEFATLLDQAIADAINQGVASGAFRQSGDAFGNMIMSLLDTSFSTKETEAGPAIGAAISQWFEGAVGSVYFEHSAGAIAGAFVTVLNQSIQNSLRDASNDFNNALIGYFTNTLPDAIRKVNSAFNQAAKDMWQGFVDGLNFNIGSFDMGKWANDHIVIPIKNLLGIASPSTLFMGIGRDIVLGLIAGFGSAIGSFISIVQSFIDMVLQLFAPVLSIFGIDLGTSTGTGTTGGGAGTHAGPGGTSTSGSVVNNFYGPVYFGDMSSIGYDCPSPSPLVAASANTLIRSGIG